MKTEILLFFFFSNVGCSENTYVMLFLKNISMTIFIFDGNLVNVSVVVNFLSRVILVFLLFLGMVISANEVETKLTLKKISILNSL